MQILWRTTLASPGEWYSFENSLRDVSVCCFLGSAWVVNVEYYCKSVDFHPTSSCVSRERTDCCIRFIPQKTRFSSWLWLRAISTHKVRKMPILLYWLMTNELSMRSCSWNVTDSNQPIGDLINQGQVLDMTVQIKFLRFLLGAICGWNIQSQILFRPRT